MVELVSLPSLEVLGPVEPTPIRKHHAVCSPTAPPAEDTSSSKGRLRLTGTGAALLRVKVGFFHETRAFLKPVI